MKFLFSKKGLFIALIILLILIAIFVDMRIGQRNYYNPFRKFAFELDFGAYGRNNVDTFRNLLTKDLVLSGPINTNFKFSGREKKEIFNRMYKMDILSYPLTLNDGFHDFEHPENYVLRVKIDNEEKTIYWSAPWSFFDEDMDKLSDQQIAFKELVEYIKGIVYNSRKYKSLPAHEGGYL